MSHFFSPAFSRLYSFSRLIARLASLAIFLSHFEGSSGAKAASRTFFCRHLGPQRHAPGDGVLFPPIVEIAVNYFFPHRPAALAWAFSCLTTSLCAASSYRVNFRFFLVFKSRPNPWKRIFCLNFLKSSSISLPQFLIWAAFVGCGNKAAATTISKTPIEKLFNETIGGSLFPPERRLQHRLFAGVIALDTEVVLPLAHRAHAGIVLLIRGADGIGRRARRVGVGPEAQAFSGLALVDEPVAVALLDDPAVGGVQRDGAVAAVHLDRQRHLLVGQL